MKTRQIETEAKRKETMDRRDILYPIEKNVPMPLPKVRKTVAAGGRTRSTLKYPLDKMKIGDSFFVSKAECKGNPHSKIQMYLARHPELMFSVRKEKKEKVDGWRVWRIPRRWKMGDA